MAFSVRVPDENETVKRLHALPRRLFAAMNARPAPSFADEPLSVRTGPRYLERERDRAFVFLVTGDREARLALNSVEDFFDSVDVPVSSASDQHFDDRLKVRLAGEFLVSAVLVQPADQLLRDLPLARIVMLGRKVFVALRELAVFGKTAFDEGQSIACQVIVIPCVSAAYQRRTVGCKWPAAY
jgi:hypothetical protein